MIYGAWICLLSPLAAAGLITLAGERISRRGAGYLATLSCFVAFGGAVATFIGLLGQDGEQRSIISTAWTWISGGSYRSGFEIMLNGANLALIAFARHLNNGDGQIFALTVMAVAASEVVVGLGLIVALNRKRVPLDVDRLSSLRG